MHSVQTSTHIHWLLTSTEQANQKWYARQQSPKFILLATQAPCCYAAALLCNNSCQDKSTLLTLLTEAMRQGKIWSAVWVLMQLLNICICFQVTAVAACVQAGCICQRFTAFGNASRRYTARTCCGEIIIPTNKHTLAHPELHRDQQKTVHLRMSKRVGSQVGFKE